MAYFSPKTEIKKTVHDTLDDVLPAWEANYEPGNVSDYLIGYANSEAAAKGAAIAWVTSQSDKDPASLEWVEEPTGDQHDHWYDLIQNHDDGIPTDTGVNVRHRLPAGIRDAARQAAGQQPSACTCDDAGACFVPAGHYRDCPHPKAAVEQPAEARRARYELLHYIGVDDEEANAMVDAYRAEILREAADELPELLRTLLTERYADNGNPFSRMVIHFQSPDGWPATKPVSADTVAEALRDLLRRMAEGPQ